MIPQLATVPNSGIPAGFRKKTPNGDARMGAGMMFMTPDGKALFMRRKGADHAGEWEFPGGRVEEDEEPADAARREAMEECGQIAGWDIAPLHRETLDHIDYTTFGQPVAMEFTPVITPEHSEHRWAALDQPPQPLHPGVEKLLAKFFAEEAGEQEHVDSPAAAELQKRFASQAPGATDSAVHIAMDQESVRSYDSDNRMHVSFARISKANICPYKGDEIPGWEELGLEKDRIYQLLRDPTELANGAKSFNGIQLLKKHVPVDANDHKMWDIIGTTGTDAAFDGTYLTNSLHVWTQEGIDFIESGDKREISCGYHYVPLMTPGKFGGKSYDGVMTNIEGNHVALVEEGRAGHDVVVGDSALDQKDDDMAKPTRLEYHLLTSTARAINPLLATDAKVDYGPIFRGLTSKNFKARKPGIIDGLKKLVTGKTIAQDASLEHVAEFLNKFEHTPPAEKSWAPDESVSGQQHRAMEAAAHGQSTLGIPQHVGKEFSDADKGKHFGDMVRDRFPGMSNEDYAALDKMHSDCARDAPPDGEEVNIEVEEGEDESSGTGGAIFDRKPAKDRKKAKDMKKAKDRKRADDEIEFEEGEEADDQDIEEEEAEADDADIEEEEGEADDQLENLGSHARDRRRGAKDRKSAKDRRAMDSKNYVTLDEMNKQIAAVQKRSRDAAAARQFVRPYVGDVALALDSAESILRAAAKAMAIEDAGTVHASALKSLIKMAGSAKQREHQMAMDAELMAQDEGGSGDAEVDSFNKFFPGAARIGLV